MDEHESNTEPTPIASEVTRRTVIETGTTALLLTDAAAWLLLAAGPSRWQRPPPPPVKVELQINGRSAFADAGSAHDIARTRCVNISR